MSAILKNFLLSFNPFLLFPSGKRTSKDRKRFYSIALGSLREVQALMDLLDKDDLYKKSDVLGAAIWCLYQNPGSLEP